MFYKKKWVKVLAICGLFLFFLIGTYYTKGSYISKDMKNVMYIGFDNFGKALEELNINVSKIIVLKNYDELNNGNYIDTSKISSFVRYIDKVSKHMGIKNNYKFPDLYLYRINDTIGNILADAEVSKDEEEYLMILYKYNEELIEEYNSILSDVSETNGTMKIKILENRIIKIYSDFSKISDKLLSENQYKLLQYYKGDFLAEESFDKIEAYSKDIFKKLGIDKELIYNNKTDNYTDKYTLRTHKESDAYNDSIETQYVVEYDKNTGKLYVQAIAFTLTEKIQRLSEAKLDDISKDIVDKFNSNANLYKKKIIYDDDNKIDRIEYGYIQKIDGVYDEITKIKITVEYNGLVSSFSITYPKEKYTTQQIVNQEDIVKKLDKNGEINEILIIRNIHGEMEYEVHIKYGDTEYAAVFNGYNSNLKYYGRDIRPYK